MCADICVSAQTVARLCVYGAFKAGLDRSRRYDRIHYSEVCATEEYHFQHGGVLAD